MPTVLVECGSVPSQTSIPRYPLQGDSRITSPDRQNILIPVATDSTEALGLEDDEVVPN